VRNPDKYLDKIQASQILHNLFEISTFPGAIISSYSQPDCTTITHNIRGEEMTTQTRTILLSTLAAILVLAFGLTAVIPLTTASAAPLQRWGVPGGGNPVPNGSSVPGSRAGMGGGFAGQGRGYQAQPATTPLSSAEKDALISAILEEYKALNLYQSAIQQLGSIAPFTQIARSEQQHVNILTSMANKYGVSVPANPGLASPVELTSLAAACQAGFSAETEDAALYDTLKAATTHSDLLQVYSNLQNASLNNHLPAFQACD
jgi:hypothetical protein